MAKKKGNRGVSKAVKKSSSTLPLSSLKSQVLAENKASKFVSVEAVKNVTLSQPVLLKLCRLCEAKDGPFFNIFDAEKVLARKINDLLPFKITENDELPHKICFRCSAKVEELYDFVQKCIRAQDNLNSAMGKKETASLYRKKWEEQLNKTKMSNEDICDALIKKAMQGIIPMDDIGSSPSPPGFAPESDQEESPIQEEISPVVPVKKGKKDKQDDVEEEKLSQKKIPLLVQPESSQDDKDSIMKESKVKLDKVSKKGKKDSLPSRPTRSTPIEPLVDGLEFTPPKKSAEKKVTAEPVQDVNQVKVDTPKIETPKGRSTQKKSASKKEPPVASKKEPPVASKKEPQVVNKKEPLVVSKKEPQVASKKETPVIRPKEQPPQVEIESSDTSDSESDDAPSPIPPKEPTPEKVIHTVNETKNNSKPFDIMDHVCQIKVNGVGLLFQCKLCNRNFLKRDVVLNHGCAKPKPADLQAKIDIQKRSETPKSNSNITIIPDPQRVPKPKAGPASRVSRIQYPPSYEVVREPTREPTPPPKIPMPTSNVEVSQTFQGAKGRYKLVPGPNNTFTLVQDPVPQAMHNEPEHDMAERMTQLNAPSVSNMAKKIKEKMKRKSEVVVDLEDQNDRMANPSLHRRAAPPVQVVQRNLMQQAPPTYPNHSQPYPVGLFQTIPMSTPGQPFPVSNPPPQPIAPNPYPTPAMKKQSYTVVQTGNPSKLLISTKHLASQEAPPVPKGKKHKKKSPHTATPEPQKQNSIALEERAQTKDNDDNFFNFITLDPLLQPSYVLPTDNIIQESQISTSTPVASTSQKPKNSYTCEICDLEFSREKKLLAHIQSHYKKLDEEDVIAAKRKKSRK